jgi:hypothetical protein
MYNRQTAPAAGTSRPSAALRPLAFKAAHGGVGGILLRRRGAEAAAGAPKSDLQVNTTHSIRIIASVCVRQGRLIGLCIYAFYHMVLNLGKLPACRHRPRAPSRRALRRGRAGAKINFSPRAIQSARRDPARQQAARAVCCKRGTHRARRARPARLPAISACLLGDDLARCGCERRPRAHVRVVTESTPLSAARAAERPGQRRGGAEPPHARMVPRSAHLVPRCLVPFLPRCRRATASDGERPRRARLQRGTQQSRAFMSSAFDVPGRLLAPERAGMVVSRKLCAAVMSHAGACPDQPKGRLN